MKQSEPNRCFESYSKHLRQRAPLQVAEQEKELDAAYDGLEGELRKVPCKNWHKVRHLMTQYHLCLHLCLASLRPHHMD